LIAGIAVAWRADRLGDGLATPPLGGMESEERVLRPMIAEEEGGAVMLRAVSTW
jgi:hypothetical protein